MGVAFWCLVGCGGKEFSSDSSAGSGGSAGSNQGGNDAGGNAQGGASGGVAGDVTTGGSATAGNAGSAGSGPVGCNCPAGSYCRDGSTDCRECSELARLRFSAPEKLATLSDGGGSRFPRVGATDTDLLYQFSGDGLRYTTDSSTSAGSSVAQTMPDDRAPLLLSSNIGTLPATVKPFNFVFDRLVEEPRRRLYFGQWDDGLLSAAEAPPPYNAEGSSNFGLAIAAQHAPGVASRAYWMTDRRAGATALMTALLSLDTAEEVVALNVGEAACHASEDVTPWITPDGATLFLSHTRPGPAPACSLEGSKKDIYWSRMNPDSGQPLNGAAATLLDDVNSAANDVDPSFSADFCDVYFASDRDGKYALYRAHRR